MGKELSNLKQRSILKYKCISSMYMIDKSTRKKLDI